MRGCANPAIAFVLLAAVAVASSPAEPPIRVPSGPVVPVPMPPRPGPDAPLRLAADQLLVIEADIPVIVLASPAGLVSVGEEAGPVRVRGRFVDGVGTETRTYKGKQVFTVEAVKTGRVELLVVPLGLKSAADVVRRTVDVDAGTGPQPPPKPEPQPGPVAEGKRYILLVEETADANASRGKLFTDATLFQRIKDRGHIWRAADKDVRDAAGNVPADLKPYLDRAAGKKLPQVFIVAPDGTVLIQAECPADAATLLELLKRAGG